MNYSKLSDFEINKRVARALDLISPDNDRTAIDCYLESKAGCGVNWFKVGDEDATYFDPCNNPSDAWPIIFENEIAIIPPVSNGTNGWKAERFFPKNCGKLIDAIDKNPLRAAMIVYLMMQEG